MSRRVLPFAALAALVSAVYLAGGFAGPARRLADLGFALAPRPATGDVVVVAIDPRSLRTLEVWPWARGYHATVIENLRDAGARRIAFDLDFSSRSDRPAEDGELAAALAAAGGEVILPSFHQAALEDGRPYIAHTAPIELLRRHATLVTINIRPDGDGLVREYTVRDAGGRVHTPSFALALSGLPPPAFDRFRIDFGIDPRSIPRLSYLDVLTGRFDAERVRDRAVIIGATAVELGDQVAVPRYASLPGPAVQALAYESLVQGRALRSGGRTVTLGLTLAIGFLALVLFEQLSWRTGLAAVAAISSGLVAAALAAQASAPVLIDVGPALAILLGGYGLALARRLDRQRLRLLWQALRIRRSEDLMRHVVDNSFDAILTLDPEGRVETSNPAAEAMFRAPAERLTGLYFSELVLLSSGEPEAERRFGTADPGEPCEAIGCRADGTTFPMELTTSTIAGERDRRVTFLRDISRRKANEQALQYQATHDALTRLPNRVLLRERTAEALAAASGSGGPVAFLIVDLDRFKEVNDTLGHHVGDVLLQKIARRLPRPLRESDTVARFGGDEFAVLLPGTALAEAERIGRELIAVLAEPVTLYGLSLPVEASVGIAMYPEHGVRPAELIQRADVAMYVAKRSRSELAVYHPDQDFTSVRNLTLSGDLRHAIEDDQLTLCFQPKVACDTSRLVGVEALVRWMHPSEGLLPPGEFIEVAEHSGLIKPLSHWVLRAALRQCAEWYRQGLPIAVAVNLSARNLQEEELPRRLEEMLHDLEVPPYLLTLEITESVIMENPQRAMEVVSAFHAMGVRIAIDDFGTGYSSLAYLKRLPAEEIKIDRAFVAGVDQDKDDAVIVRSTIEMAHNLGLSVVAEGIETESVWQRIREFGCNSGQGYFFSRPLAADEFLTWLKASRWQVEDNQAA